MGTGCRYAEIIHREYENSNPMAYYAFFLGVGQCKLELKEGSGHNVPEVVAGIHEYYSSQGKARKAAIIRGVQEGLGKCVELTFSLADTDRTIGIISCELKYEQDHPKSFRINADVLIEELRQKIRANYPSYIREYDPAYVDSILQDRNSYLVSHFGYSIL